MSSRVYSGRNSSLLSIVSDISGRTHIVFGWSGTVAGTVVVGINTQSLKRKSELIFLIKLKSKSIYVIQRLLSSNKPTELTLLAFL